MYIYIIFPKSSYQMRRQEEGASLCKQRRNRMLFRWAMNAELWARAAAVSAEGLRPADTHPH